MVLNVFVVDQPAQAYDIYLTIYKKYQIQSTKYLAFQIQGVKNLVF